MKNSKKKINWQPQKGKKTDSLNLAQNQQKRKGGIFGRNSTLIPGVYLFGRDGRHESPPCRPNITSFIFGFRFWLNVFHVLMLSDNGAEVLVYWGPDSCANDDDTGNETQTFAALPSPRLNTIYLLPGDLFGLQKSVNFFACGCCVCRLVRHERMEGEWVGVTNKVKRPDTETEKFFLTGVRVINFMPRYK